MAKKPDPTDAAALAALSLAADRPWRDITLRDIAEAAGLKMTALYGVVRSKDDVIDALMRHFDRAAADELDLDADGSVRERVFDASMARFDAMDEHRAGLVAIIDAQLQNPLGVARMWPRAMRTARWLLELAAVDTSGAVGAARVQGFTAVLARTTRAWLRDDAGDLAKTMSTLDRALRDVEEWSERLRGASTRTGGEPNADARPPEASDETA